MLCKVVVDGLVLLYGVYGGALQAVADEGEPFQYIARHVESQHGHQYDVHQVYHLLTWRERTFLYGHGLFFSYKLLGYKLQVN